MSLLLREIYNLLPSNYFLLTSYIFLALFVYLILAYKQTHFFSSYFLSLLLSTVFAFQPMLLSLILLFVSLFLCMVFSSIEIYIKDLLIVFGWVYLVVFIMYYRLLEPRSHPVQNDINNVVVCYFVMDIIYINIIEVFLDSACLLEITDLINSPVALVVVVVAYTNSVYDLFPYIDPMTAQFPPFQRICFPI